MRPEAIFALDSGLVLFGFPISPDRTQQCVKHNYIKITSHEPERAKKYGQ
jgi:hypothetical protein